MSDKMTAKKMNIYWTGSSQAVGFAALELKKYLERMSAEDILLTVEGREKYNPFEHDALWVGTWNEFQSIRNISASKLNEVENPRMDDAIYIDVKEGRGIITGVNDRSVLLAVYRFLAEAGCRWVRPGADGEYIPEKDISALSVQVDEKAAYRHRGICIEGAVSYENVAEIIDWAPKIGFNGYFIQFREAYTFFDRWYSHRNNPLKQPEQFSVEKAREYVKRAENEIKKRGLLYHAVGHGWTCEPLGIPGLSWDPGTYDVPPEVARYLAEINGKREVWQGIPLNTNLCYSNSEVRSLVVNSIADYLEGHKDIDILHFWLADGVNNQCECENCKKAIPSDFYVMMLNDLDELLTQRGIHTKIVFLIYVDLLWAPEHERIKNPDRFILMFAPITRTYSRDFTSEYTVTELPEYRRNSLKFPSKVEENVAFLKSWQKIFKGDSFDFDYHFMWDHYNDPGYYNIARILSSDIKHLKDIGLNGFVSCQVQRSFFPTGLGMYVMGRTLWNDKVEFDDVAKDYFYSAFGADGELCREYLAELSGLFDPPYLRNEKPQVSRESAEKFSRIPQVIDDFRPVIERNLSQEDKCRAKSWLYLKHHADICVCLARALEAKARGDKKTAAELWEKIKRIVQEKEDEIQPVFDLCIFINTMEKKFVF